MKRFLVVAAGFGWAFVAFGLTFWATFPGDAVAERLEYMVSDSSRGNYALDLGDVGPWWLGLSTDSVKVYTRGAPGQPANQLTMYATDARMAAGLASLITRQPRVSGSLVVGEGGELDYVVGTAMDEKGSQLQVNELRLSGDAFPAAELLTLIPGAELNGAGTLDIRVDLDAPEGMSKASGSIAFKGTGVSLVSPVIADFPLGRDVAFSELDIELEVVDGRARIVRGKVGSDVANIDLSGDIVFDDDISRSRVDIRAELSLDASMKMLEGMLASAKKDDKFVYRCAGALNRMPNICTPDGAGRVAGNTRPGRGSRPARLPPTGTPGEKVEIEAGVAPAMTEEQREQRRSELQERLRKRREAREGAGGPKRPGELVDDELPPDEELPPEDEVPNEEDLILDEEDLPPEEEFYEE